MSSDNWVEDVSTDLEVALRFLVTSEATVLRSFSESFDSAILSLNETSELTSSPMSLEDSLIGADASARSLIILGSLSDDVARICAAFALSSWLLLSAVLFASVRFVIESSWLFNTFSSLTILSVRSTLIPLMSLKFFCTDSLISSVLCLKRDSCSADILSNTPLNLSI